MIIRILNSFSSPVKRPTQDAADDFQLSMRTTANCRHNAASRLQSHARIAFISSTVLSLSLTFIPLMQNSGVDLALKDSVLNMMQIFLGVATLVYSLVIGTARYDLRALQLSQCADRIKDLIRELKLERLRSGGVVSLDYLASAQRRYSEILASSENHEPIDYSAAMLDMPNDYTIRIGRASVLKGKSFASHAWAYVGPLALLIMISLMITEMFAISRLTEPHLPSWRKSAAEVQPS